MGTPFAVYTDDLEIQAVNLLVTTFRGRCNQAKVVEEREGGKRQLIVSFPRADEYAEDWLATLDQRVKMIRTAVHDILPEDIERDEAHKAPQWKVQDRHGWGWSVYDPDGKPGVIEAVSSRSAAEAYAKARTAGKSHEEAWQAMRDAGGQTRSEYRGN